MTSNKVVSYLFFAALLVLVSGLIYTSLGKKAEWVENTKPTKVASEKQATYDLSYIAIYSDEKTDIVLIDSSGKKLGQAQVQQPMVDPETKQALNSPINIFYYRKPISGFYTLKLTPEGKGEFSVDIFLYDKEGNVLQKVFNGLGGKTSSLKINFDRDDVQNSSIE